MMNALRNQVQLIGNLGMDPEAKILDSGKQLVRFSLATNETYRNSRGERVTETQWHNLVAWGKTAELIQKLLHKGVEVAVQGKLNTRSYQDKEGNKRFVTEIIVNDFILLGSRAA